MSSFDFDNTIQVQQRNTAGVWRDIYTTTVGFHRLPVVATNSEGHLYLAYVRGSYPERFYMSRGESS